MTQNHQDLLALIEEIKLAKQQLMSAHDHKEQMVQEFKKVSDQYEQADRQYMSLMNVFEYCVAHDCDPAYAKLTLSATPTVHPSPKLSGRGTKLYALPQENVVSGHQYQARPRTIKQKMVDWLLKS